MQHDLQLRAAARVIYDACYPSEEWAPVREKIGFKSAAIAVARKLSVIMHTMLKSGELFVRSPVAAA